MISQLGIFHVVLTCLSSLSYAQTDHYDLDQDGIVAVDEFVAVAYTEYGLEKEDLEAVMEEVNRDKDGELQEEQLRLAKRRLREIQQKRAATWIEENDTNEDNVLSFSELASFVTKEVSARSKEVSEIFRMADRDADGFLSLPEAPFALALIRTKILLDANDFIHSLQKFDSDGNGRLSEEEAILLADVAFDVGTEEALDAFERVAANEVDIGRLLVDGFILSLRESAIFKTQETMKEVDKDGDGSVNFHELLAKFPMKKVPLLKRLFKRVDINNDLTLDAPEWVQLIGEMSRIKKKGRKSIRNGEKKIIHVRPRTSHAFEGVAREEENKEGRKKRSSGVEEEIIPFLASNSLLTQNNQMRTFLLFKKELRGTGKSDENLSAFLSRNL